MSEVLDEHFKFYNLKSLMFDKSRKIIFGFNIKTVSYGRFTSYF